MIKSMDGASIQKKMEQDMKGIGHMESNMDKDNSFFKMVHQSLELGATVKELIG